MSTRTCLGVKQGNIKCSNKVTHPVRYCRHHNSQGASRIDDNSSIRDNELPIDNSLSIDYHDESNQIGADPCSICLCDVDDKDDCQLICGHKHHIECINKMIDPFCPQCKGPLKFKSINNGVSVSNIKKRSQKEQSVRDQEMTQTNIGLAQELQNEDLRERSIGLNLLTDLNDWSNVDASFHSELTEDEMIDKAIQESLITNTDDSFYDVLEESITTADNDEYELCSKIIEESYYSALKEDEEILARVMAENIETNTKDFVWNNDYLKTIMKGNTHITLQLK